MNTQRRDNQNNFSESDIDSYLNNDPNLIDYVSLSYKRMDENINNSEIIGVLSQKIQSTCIFVFQYEITSIIYKFFYNYKLREIYICKIFTCDQQTFIIKIKTYKLSYDSCKKLLPKHIDEDINKYYTKILTINQFLKGVGFKNQNRSVEINDFFVCTIKLSGDEKSEIKIQANGLDYEDAFMQAIFRLRIAIDTP